MSLPLHPHMGERRDTDWQFAPESRVRVGEGYWLDWTDYPIFGMLYRRHSSPESFFSIPNRWLAL